MNIITRSIRRRCIRRLAERIMAHQIAYQREDMQFDMADAAIDTAAAFYETWHNTEWI